MIEKTVKIGDTDVKFRSSASVPRLYRIKFGRDIFKDLSRLEKSYKEKGGEEASAMEITTALFLLRCLEVGLSLSDLDLLTIGMVLDIWTEKGNDGEKYETKAVVREANQHDFDVF